MPAEAAARRGVKELATRAMAVYQTATTSPAATIRTTSTAPSHGQPGPWSNML